jgi:hypothetical protein
MAAIRLCSRHPWGSWGNHSGGANSLMLYICSSIRQSSLTAPPEAPGFFFSLSFLLMFKGVSLWYFHKCKECALLSLFLMKSPKLVFQVSSCSFSIFICTSAIDLLDYKGIWGYLLRVPVSISWLGCGFYQAGHHWRLCQRPKMYVAVLRMTSNAALTSSCWWWAFEPDAHVMLVAIWDHGRGQSGSKVVCTCKYWTR